MAISTIDSETNHKWISPEFSTYAEDSIRGGLQLSGTRIVVVLRGIREM